MWIQYVWIPRIEGLTSKNTIHCGVWERLYLNRNIRFYGKCWTDINEHNPHSLKAHTTWLEKHDEVYGLIIVTLPAEQAMTVRVMTKAKQKWKLLKKCNAELKS